MDTDALRSALDGGFVREIRWVPETGSTNEDLLVAARAGEAAGLVLMADHQTAGRGRLDRSWTAPPGSSLLLSVLLRPDLPLEQVHLAVSAVGVAVVEAVEALGVDAVLKWPNDVVVERDGWVRKLGGILAESVVAGGSVDAVVVGLGLNVDWPADRPPEVADLAVTLGDLLGEPPSVADVAVAVLRGVESWLGRLGTAPGRATLVHRYRDHCATLGHRVRVEMPGERFEGVARDLTADGHLLVEVPGEVEWRPVLAGDVVHLRTVAG